MSRVSRKLMILCFHENVMLILKISFTQMYAHFLYIMMSDNVADVHEEGSQVSDL